MVELCNDNHRVGCGFFFSIWSAMYDRIEFSTENRLTIAYWNADDSCVERVSELKIDFKKRDEDDNVDVFDAAAVTLYTLNW